jgi:hypothetical protein
MPCPKSKPDPGLLLQNTSLIARFPVKQNKDALVKSKSKSSQKIDKGKEARSGPRIIGPEWRRLKGSKRAVSDKRARGEREG